MYLYYCLRTKATGLWDLVHFIVGRVNYWSKKLPKICFSVDLKKHHFLFSWILMCKG